jgi:DNA/RNA-binding domain of Phe-tRNA-synthetase-like protein
MSDDVEFLLSDDLTPVVAPGLLMFEAVTVLARDARMDAPIAETEARIRVNVAHAGGVETSPTSREGVGEAVDFTREIALVRAMYKRFGLDPTKVRPSSEALLRRVKKGEPLPRINSLVDICNWCSLETQLPFGLYDADRIEGTMVSLRVGGAGEGYDGIRKDRVNVDGRLTLTDARGPFGNPTSDSARTMVTLDAHRVLFVVYCPREHEKQGLARALDLTARRVQEFTGASASLRRTL